VAKAEFKREELLSQQRDRLVAELEALIDLIEQSRVHFFTPEAIIDQLRLGLNGTDFADQVDFVECFTISRDDADLQVRTCGIEVTFGGVFHLDRDFTVSVGALPILTR
jgi:hypothetical protein